VGPHPVGRAPPRAVSWSSATASPEAGRSLDLQQGGNDIAPETAETDEQGASGESSEPKQDHDSSFDPIEGTQDATDLSLAALESLRCAAEDFESPSQIG
jgi:hypothetical protein